MSDCPILFDDFKPGHILGEVRETVSLSQMKAWRSLYDLEPAQPDTVPLGLATVLMMRAYLTAVAPRPPGNLHAQQSMRVFRRIALDEIVVTRIACQAKELRGLRRKVDLLATGASEDGRPIFTGLITLFWAA